MGERAEEVGGSEPLGEHQAAVSGEDLEGRTSTSASSDDEEIAAARADIEETRAEMSETIDAIEEKLSPEHLKEQAKESVKQATVGKLDTVRRRAGERAGRMADTARGAGATAWERVKQNPVPAAGVGLSLTGLAVGAGVLQLRRQRSEQIVEVSGPASLTERLNQVQQTVGQVFGQTGGAATRIVGRDGKRVHQLDANPPLRDRVQVSRVILGLGAPIVGLGLIAALGALRRRMEGVNLGVSLPGRQKGTASVAPVEDARSSIVKRLVLIIAVAVPAGVLAAKRLRQRGGQVTTMTRTDLVMAWLNNAYSMETGLVHTLQSHARDAQEFPQLQARIQQHVEETRRHADLVRGCIERRGGSPSGLKSGMATVMGKAQGVAMRPAQDKVVKNTLADSSAEQLEISSYRALVAAAQDLGDQETAAICQQILGDEEDMARFLDQNLPTVVTQTMHGMPAATS